jgi:hypothetical protein
VSEERLTSWLERFRFYREPPDKIAIERWLERFSEAHRDVAARVLDSVEILSEREILNAYRTMLSGLPNWNIDPRQRRGRWAFVGFGGAGESGPSMLRLFREANGMTSRAYDQFFHSPTDLPSLQLTAEDQVVFVDDFAGTGDQVCRTWPVLQELIASEARCYLILTAATEDAISKIASRTSLVIMVSYRLTACDNLFNEECEHFSGEEKNVILSYNRKADRRNPRGYGNCGLLFILSHKTPNNTLPILHAHHRRWRGLFPRYLHIQE